LIYAVFFAAGFFAFFGLDLGLEARGFAGAFALVVFGFAAALALGAAFVVFAFLVVDLALVVLAFLAAGAFAGEAERALLVPVAFFLAGEADLPRLALVAFFFFGTGFTSL